MKCPDCDSVDVYAVQGTRKMACRQCRLSWWLPAPRLTEAEQEANKLAMLRKIIESMDADPQQPLYVTPGKPIVPFHDDKGKLIV